MDKTIEFKEKYVYTYSYSCDDEGNVYIIYWGGEDKMKYKNGNTVYQDRHIMVLRADNGQVIDLPYKLEDNYMTNHRMVYSPKEDKLYVMALYGKGMDDNYLGVRYTRIDRKLWKMEPFVNVEFPKEIVDQFDRDGFASTKQKNMASQILLAEIQLLEVMVQ